MMFIGCPLGLREVFLFGGFHAGKGERMGCRLLFGLSDGLKNSTAGTHIG